MNDRELAAELVLGEVEEGRRAELERRLRAEPAFRAEVEALQAMTERLQDLPGDAWPAAEQAKAASPR
ncbi:MAG TPA: hypothetical protein VFS26_06165, partial [Solirubrobacterales bacterium]|nr:hypothetical protein [Solirubrobacterales bacterium]